MEEKEAEQRDENEHERRCADRSGMGTRGVCVNLLGTPREQILSIRVYYEPSDL